MSEEETETPAEALLADPRITEKVGDRVYLGQPEPWCWPDGCPASICNGPHVSHACDDFTYVTMRVGSPTPCPFCGRTA